MLELRSRCTVATDRGEGIVGFLLHEGRGLLPNLLRAVEVVNLLSGIHYYAKKENP